jgi:hypothetical protein
MEFLKFAWKNIKLFIAWAVFVWLVFISNIVRNAFGIDPATSEEQGWAMLAVVALFIVFSVDSIVRYRKLHK